MSEYLLSVIMPVYNAQPFIVASIKSILNQSYRNIELIIINDASTDNSLAEILSVKDKRIKLFSNEENRGIVFSRNKGLKLAKGDFIGMMDADDIALPEKFEKQISFLLENPTYGMVGSWVDFIDEKGDAIPGGWKLTASVEMIPSIMLFKNYFLQSAVLYRKECINSFSFTHGLDILEDYAIWNEIIKEFKAWNIQEPLVKYRLHSGSVTQSKKAEMFIKEKHVFQKQFQQLGIEASDEELDLHLMIKHNQEITSIRLLKSMEQWLLKILKQNETKIAYDPKMLSRVVFNRWLKVFTKAKALHIFSLYHFAKSPIVLQMLKSYFFFNANMKRHEIKA